MMECISKTVVVWGTGIEAAKFSYKFESALKIFAYIDNNGDYGSFRNKKVYKLSQITNVKDYFYFFAGSLGAYEREIRPQLLELGMEEFKDFLFYAWFQKKMVLLHGNCHMGALKTALECSGIFNEEYYVYPHAAICNYKKGETVDYRLLENCDVFIHEDIRAENQYGYMLSDEYLVPKLKQDCLNITVPHLFELGGDGFLNVMALICRT